MMSETTMMSENEFEHTMMVKSIGWCVGCVGCYLFGLSVVTRQTHRLEPIWYY